MLSGHKKGVNDLKFLRSQPELLLSASEDKTVRLWNIGSTVAEIDNSRYYIILMNVK
jgi:WD40 repeat protein